MSPFPIDPATINSFAVAVLAYVLQTAVLLGIGLALPTLFRLRDPRACLAYGYGLLLAILCLPLWQPEPEKMRFAAELTVTGDWLGQLAASGAEAGALSPWKALLSVLAAGVLLRLGWLGLGLVRLGLLRRDARPAALDPAVSSLVQAILGERSARTRLLLSRRIESPVTFGWLAPVVLLPAGFAALAPEARRGILCHELLHVRRRDWLFALFEEGVRCLLWFHPAVWLLLARIALSREQVVDREVVRRTGSLRSYLEALRTVACSSWQTPVHGLPFFHRGHLRQRVVQLCKEVPMSRPRIATLMTTFASLLALTAILGILAFPMSGTAWAGGEPRKVGGNIHRPEIKSQEPPVYPAQERADKVEGMVILSTVITEEGRVDKVEVAKSSGNANLDQSAVDAVRKWTFHPATENGKPVTVLYTLTINFQVK
jgi:TonB family protein